MRRKPTLLQDIREMVEQKLQQMLQYNPQGMDYYKKYQEIIFEAFPNPPYSADETQAAADRIYEYVWQRSANGSLFPRDIAA